VLKQAHTVEFVTQAEAEPGAENFDVIRAAQFLMNARARNEAMNLMDAGDYTRAGAVVRGALYATQVAFEPFEGLPEMPSIVQERASLEEAVSSLKDRFQDKLSRKKLAYAAYSRRSGK